MVLARIYLLHYKFLVFYKNIILLQNHSTFLLLIFVGLDGKAKLIIKKDGSESVTINDTYGKTTLYDIDVPIKYISGFGSSNSYKSNSYGSNSYVSPNVSYYNFQSNDDSSYYSNDKSSYQSNDKYSSHSNDKSSYQSNDYSNDKSDFNNNVTQKQAAVGSTYDSVFPPGVSKSMIPPGQENLYILKSQIVPPVCPSQCANSSSSSSDKKCPPCPGCERCKEPDFACKKVPNYGDSNSDKNSFGGWDRDKGSRSTSNSPNYDSPNGNWGNGGGNGASYG